jgi:hypothetical protein
MIFKLPKPIVLPFLFASWILPAATAPAEDIRFPDSAGVIDVTKTPYQAKPDGVTDCTAAIQRALDDHPAQGAIIYLPNGVYRLTNTLHWPSGKHGGQEQKLTVLQGQSRTGVVLRLPDACAGYQNPQKPREMVNTGGRPAQRFFNSIRNCTFDTGKGNPGAIGVRFNASNCGALRDVDIRSGDGAGVVGLDQAYADDFGPCLVKNMSVTGFDVGIAVAHGVNGIVYEHIKLKGQNRVGWENRGMPITIRGLRSENRVPALRNVEWYGLVTLVDADLSGTGPASTMAAIERLAGGLFVRNLKVSGYAHAICSESKNKPTKFIPGPLVNEWVSSGRLPGSGEHSLGLPVKETPDVPWDDPKDWAVLTDFGGKTGDRADDSGALQRAMDAGQPTVCLPRGKVVLKQPIKIRGHVRRVIGTEAELVMPEAFPLGTSIFTVEDGPEPVVVVERMMSFFWNNRSGANWIDNPTKRTLVLRDLADVENCPDYAKGNVITGPGELFLEDVVGRFHFQPGQKVWARWLNPETNFEQRQKTPESQWHLKNDGAQLWILGIKTEGPGPVIITRQGGATELLGGLMYSSGGAKTQTEPAFIFEDSHGSVTISEANFGNNRYPVLRNLRAGKTAFELVPNQTPGAPGGSMIPFWATP